MRQFYYFLISFLFFTLNCQSQEPYFITIDKSKGLPSNNVFNIFQDSRGFIWIAHEEGLTRYDGYEMKTYECPEQTSKAGTNIAEDKFGRIWYENFDGYLYYVEHDSLKPLHQGKPFGFMDYGLTKNKLFVCIKSELVIYDLKDLKISHSVKIREDLLVSTVCSEKYFYLVSESLERVDENGISQTIKPSRPAADYFPGGSVPAFKNVVLYCADNKSKYCFQVNDTNYTLKFKLPFKEFIQTASYTDSSYWFCTPKGVYAFTETGNSLNNNMPYFKSCSISGVIKDREGNYWFGTTNQGVLLVPDLNARVIELMDNGNKLALNKSNLYISSDNGKIYRLNLLTSSGTLLFNDNSNKQGGVIKYDSLSSSVINQGNRFYILNEQGKIRFENSYAVKDFYRIDKDFFAVAATGVVGLFSFSNTLINSWGAKPSLMQQPTNQLKLLHLMGAVRGKSVAYNSKSKTIYFATNIGLFAFTETARSEIKFEGKGIYVSKLQQYGNRVFILSTQGRLYELNNQNTITEYHPENGMGPSLIKDIRVSSHYLFLISDKSLKYINLLSQASGIQDVRINLAGALISDVEVFQNKLVLLSGKRIITADLPKPHHDVLSPLLMMNEVKANGELLVPDQMSKLHYKQNNIEINYSILSFKNAGSTDLFYRINQGPWEKSATETRSLKLAALAPGDYTIQFHLGDITGQVEANQVLFFSINKPWWQSYWAIAGFISVFVFVFFIIYKWQTGILKKQNQLLLQKFDLEKDLRKSILKSIKAQMNPHFFYNALNTIQSFIFSDDKRSAATYLSKFSKLTRTILEMSEKESVTLAEETEALTLYLEIEKVRFDGDFTFEINMQETIIPELVKIPSMIIQPYVENAVKHGLLHKKGNKHLLLNFALNQRLLTVLIADNGIGRQRSAELNRIKNSKHQSFATSANSTRLSILNKDEERVGVEYVDKKDELGNALGTEVLVRIPIT